jgi:hypothetical protein
MVKTPERYHLSGIYFCFERSLITGEEKANTHFRTSFKKKLKTKTRQLRPNIFVAKEPQDIGVKAILRCFGLDLFFNFLRKCLFCFYDPEIRDDLK